MANKPPPSALLHVRHPTFCAAVLGRTGPRGRIASQRPTTYEASAYMVTIFIVRLDLHIAAARLPYRSVLGEGCRIPHDPPDRPRGALNTLR